MPSLSIGSETAKNGFRNEDDIVSKFNNWKIDKEAKEWLLIMNYDLNNVEYVYAVKLSGHKTDVQVQVTIKLKTVIDVQNLQVKLVTIGRGFNQIDKRWVNSYISLWNIPDNIVSILKRYCGEIAPSIAKPKDKRRMFTNEFSQQERDELFKWLNENKSLIVSDVLKGRGQFAAEWMLVAQRKAVDARWILKPMNFCLNFFGNGAVEFTNRGNNRIGKIGVQRKGGDGGADTAKMLQFKISPTLLFNT
jgi:hypothetical protein